MSEYDNLFSEFDTDFTDTDAPPRTPVVPDAVYPAVVEDVEIQTGQTSGEKYIHVTFRLLQTPYEEVRIHDRGRNFSLSPKAKAYAKARLEMIMGEEIPKAPFNLENYRRKLVGRLVSVKTKQEVYQGNPQNGIERIMPPGGTTAGTTPNLVPTPNERKRDGLQF